MCKSKTPGISHKPSCLPKDYLPKPVFTTAVIRQISHLPASFPEGVFGGDACSVVTAMVLGKTTQCECILLLNRTSNLQLLDYSFKTSVFYYTLIFSHLRCLATTSTLGPVVSQTRAWAHVTPQTEQEFILAALCKLKRFSRRIPVLEEVSLLCTYSICVRTRVHCHQGAVCLQEQAFGSPPWSSVWRCFNLVSQGFPWHMQNHKTTAPPKKIVKRGDHA